MRGQSMCYQTSHSLCKQDHQPHHAGSQGLVLFLGILCYLSEELTNDTLLRFMCWAQLAGYQTDLMDGKGGQTASPSDFSGNQSR